MELETRAFEHYYSNDNTYKFNLHSKSYIKDIHIEIKFKEKMKVPNLAFQTIKSVTMGPYGIDLIKLDNDYMKWYHETRITNEKKKGFDMMIGNDV